MPFVLTPVLSKVVDDLKPPLVTYSEPQLSTCVVFGNPTDVIKRHPAVFSFYQGKTDKLAVNDLAEFCRELSGANSVYGDGTRAFIVGQYVLGKISAEEDHSFLQKTFARISGKDLSQYFTYEEKPHVDDFLDNVMLIEKNKIVYPIECKKDSTRAP